MSSINRIFISITVLDTTIQEERTWHGDISSVCCLNLQFKANIKIYAEWARNNEISFNHVWFSGEAHFHSDGVLINKICDS